MIFMIVQYMVYIPALHVSYVFKTVNLVNAYNLYLLCDK